jgi:hypothetical protein
MCNHCEKFEKLDGSTLMKCQRCKIAYYCNRECQAANWKNHKTMCNRLGGASELSRSVRKTSQPFTLAFLKSNYFDIVREVYKKTQEYNVSKKELIVEIDFYGDAPALRNDFKVRLRSDFLHNRSCSHAESKVMMDACYQKERGSDLVFVCKTSNGTLSIASLGLLFLGYQFLSDEAVESIGREDYVRMVACLGLLTTEAYFRGNRSGL